MPNVRKGQCRHAGQFLAFYYFNLLDLLGIVWDFDHPQLEFEAMNFALRQGITTLSNCSIAHSRKLITGSRKPSHSSPIIMNRP